MKVDLRDIFEKPLKQHEEKKEAKAEAKAEAKQQAAAAAEERKEQAEAQGLVTPDMIVVDIISKHPEAAEFLMMDCGMGCVTCGVAAYETLEQAAAVHGLDGEDVCAALNDYLEDCAKIKAEEEQAEA